MIKGQTDRMRKTGTPGGGPVFRVEKIRKMGYNGT